MQSDRPANSLTPKGGKIHHIVECIYVSAVESFLNIAAASYRWNKLVCKSLTRSDIIRKPSFFLPQGGSAQVLSGEVTNVSLSSMQQPRSHGCDTTYLLVGALRAPTTLLCPRFVTYSTYSTYTGQVKNHDNLALFRAALSHFSTYLKSENSFFLKSLIPHLFDVVNI
jgi:hypothetical protein